MSNDFDFHAFATGFAGQITHPFFELIESQAPSALSPQGGYSSGRVEHFNRHEIFSFRAAYTQTAGAYNAATESWDTIMTSTVEGLNILGVVQADRIVARLASRHVKGSVEEPSILPLGSAIEGLQIAGVGMDVALQTDLFSRYDTYTKVFDAYRHDGDFRRTFDSVNQIGGSQVLPAHVQRHLPWGGRAAETEIPNAGRPLFTTLVKSITHKSNYLPTYGHVVEVPQFGVVVLGQFLIDGRARRLTMLKVELACAVNGSCAAGTGETNGQPIPPPNPRPSGN